MYFSTTHTFSFHGINRLCSFLQWGQIQYSICGSSSCLPSAYLIMPAMDGFQPFAMQLSKYSCAFSSGTPYSFWRRLHSCLVIEKSAKVAACDLGSPPFEIYCITRSVVFRRASKYRRVADTIRL